jgi:hypothetical protein
VLALALRAPVSMVALKLGKSPEAAQPWIVASSGPLEEGARLLVLVMLGRSFSRAASVGLGWAAIEVVYAVVSGFVLLDALGRDDEKADELRRYLLAQGQHPSPLAPWWGVVERIWATALHVGLTLLVAFRPVLVLVTAVAHAATNVLALKALRTHSVAAMEMIGLLWGLAVLAAGLLVWR